VPYGDLLTLELDRPALDGTRVRFPRGLEDLTPAVYGLLHGKEGVEVMLIDRAAP
jgi:hypothetical protein